MPVIWTLIVLSWYCRKKGYVLATVLFSSICTALLSKELFQGQKYPQNMKFRQMQKGIPTITGRKTSFLNK